MSQQEWLEIENRLSRLDEPSFDLWLEKILQKRRKRGQVGSKKLNKYPPNFYYDEKEGCYRLAAKPKSSGQVKLGGVFGVRSGKSSAR
jgi:hypothetical protein